MISSASRRQKPRVVYGITRFPWIISGTTMEPSERIYIGTTAVLLPPRLTAGQTGAKGENLPYSQVTRESKE